MATLIIGLGTSGLHVLEHIQRFYYNSYGVNKPNDVEYLYFETDKEQKPEVSFVQNDIQRVYVSLADIPLMIDHLKRTTASSWLLPMHQIIDAGAGAGGIRPCGRLAFWGNNTEVGDNFTNVISSLQTARAKLVQGDPNVRPVVFITGSLTGGTCSGSFIDMAYFIRDVIGNVQKIYGLFMLPSKQCNINTFTVQLANAYGAIKDLENYNFSDASSKNSYQETWPSLQQKTFLNNPFDFVQFISQDYFDGGAPIHTLNGLYKMAGLFLFLNIAGIYPSRAARLVDSAGNMLMGKYGTFGLSGFQFPKDQIEDYLACKLGIEILRRWQNQNSYFLNGKEHPIIEDVIGQYALVKWDEIISKAFIELNTIAGANHTNIIDEINDITQELVSHQTPEKPETYLKNKFSSNVRTNIYNRVAGNISVSQDSIINLIHDLIIVELDNTENLVYIKILLKQIKMAMNKCREYWLHINVPVTANAWNDKLSELIDWTLHNTHREVAESYDVIRDRLLSMFELLKMHLLYSKLENLEKYFEQEHHNLPIQSLNEKKELPRISTFDFIIESISPLIEYANQNGNQNQRLRTERVIMPLKARMEEITVDLNDETIPLIRIYNSGSFETDVQNATTKFANQITISREIITNEPLWEYLNDHIKLNSMQELLHQIIRKFKRTIIDNKCVEEPDFDVFIHSNTNRCKSIAQRALVPFLSLPGRIFLTNPAIPRFIIYSKLNTITNVLNEFSNSQFNDFQLNPNNTCVLPQLKNLLVFYDEKGNYIPSEHIGNINLMKTAYESGNEILQLQLETSVWQNYRKAYTPTRNQIIPQNQIQVEPKINLVDPNIAPADMEEIG